MQKPLQCPLCLTRYDYARGSICPDCRLKLRRAKPEFTNNERVAQLARLLVLSGKYTPEAACKIAREVLGL